MEVAEVVRDRDPSNLPLHAGHANNCFASGVLRLEDKLGSVEMRTLDFYRARIGAFLGYLGEKADASLNMISEADIRGWRDLEAKRVSATTVNIGALSGGVADNVIAPWAEARLMARLVGPVEQTLERFMLWADGRAEIEVGETVPAVRLTPLDGFETSVVAYATDVPNLSNWGTPYLLGPGTIHVAHTDDESVEIAELERAVELYVRLARKAVGGLE